MFTQPAQIFPAHQTQQLLAGAGGGGGGLNFNGPVSLSFGDIGGHTPEGVKGMFYDAMVELARTIKGQGGI